MTNTLSLSNLAAQIERAKAHIALAEDIAAAPALLKKLLPQYEEAVAEHERAEAAKQEEAETSRIADEKAAKDAMFAGLSDLHIEERSDKLSQSVLSSTFVIRWTRPEWLADFNETVLRQTSVVGFRGLGSAVLEWIIERNASKIPASIMALAPNDPREAIDIYLTALDRGYLKS